MVIAAFRRAGLYLSIVVAMSSACAAADDLSAVLHEVALDIDRDGVMDRAVVMKNPKGIYSELRIYLQAGGEKLDVSRKPDVLKTDLTTDAVSGLEGRSNGSLVVKYGRPGSNQYEMTLTIVYRGGEFLVGGFAKSWDMRGGIGSCDINFLTGAGVASRGLAPSKPVRMKFSPVKLTDWSDARQPAVCR